MYGKVDEKVDVYAYGILLLELITGKEATRTNQASNEASLILWVIKLNFEPTCSIFFITLSRLLTKITGKVSADMWCIRTPY